MEQVLPLRMLARCRARVLTLARLIALTVAAVVLLQAAKSSDRLLSLLELGRVCRHRGRPNVDEVLLPRRDELVAHHFDVAEIEGHGEDQGFDFAGLRLLVDVLDEVAFALDAPICDLADLLGVERLPRLVIHVLVEGHDVDGVHEVDEGVADVATVVEVQR